MSFDPLVAAGLSVSAAIALFAPLVLAVVLWRRLGASWKAWGIGALTFAVSQLVLRLPWQIPLGVWLQPRLKESAVLLWGWIAVSALTAGIFEETGRWVAYRWLWKDRSAAGGIMLGAGHGGIESMLLVGLSLAGSVATYWLVIGKGMTFGLTEAQLSAVRQEFAQVTPVLALAGGVERLSAMAVHIGCSMLVLQAWTRGSKGWLLASIGFHAASNFVGVGVMKLAGAWWAELAIAAFAAAAVAWTIVLARRPS